MGRAGDGAGKPESVFRVGEGGNRCRQQVVVHGCCGVLGHGGSPPTRMRQRGRPSRSSIQRPPGAGGQGQLVSLEFIYLEPRISLAHSSSKWWSPDLMERPCHRALLLTMNYEYLTLPQSGLGATWVPTALGSCVRPFLSRTWNTARHSGVSYVGMMDE